MLSAAPLFMPMVFYGKEHEHEYRRPQGYDQLGQTALDADHPPADEPHNEIGRGSKQLRHGETSSWDGIFSGGSTLSKNLPFRPEMIHRRSGQPCIESRFRYPNGPLENYQQKFHTPSGEGILQGANG
jgi:hypothetical protein